VDHEKHVPPDQIVDPVGIEALLRHRCVSEGFAMHEERAGGGGFVKMVVGVAR
jgi:hypothetical protein